MNRKSQKRDRVKVTVLPIDYELKEWVEDNLVKQAPAGKILSLNGLTQARVRFKREGIYKSGGNYWFEVYIKGFGFQAFEYDRDMFEWELRFYKYRELPPNKSDIEAIKILHKNGLIDNHIVLSADYQRYLYSKKYTKA